MNVTKERHISNKQIEKKKKRELEYRRDSYHERNTQRPEALWNNVCLKCKTSFKKPGYTYDGRDIKYECPTCKTELIKIGELARVPRKNASKLKWVQFCRHTKIHRIYPELYKEFIDKTFR